MDSIQLHKIDLVFDELFEELQKCSKRASKCFYTNRVHNENFKQDDLLVEMLKKHKRKDNSDLFKYEKEKSEEIVKVSSVERDLSHLPVNKCNELQLSSGRNKRYSISSNKICYPTQHEQFSDEPSGISHSNRGNKNCESNNKQLDILSFDCSSYLNSLRTEKSCSNHVMNLSATSDHRNSNHVMNLSATSEHSHLNHAMNLSATSDHSNSNHAMNLSTTSDHSNSNHAMNLSATSDHSHTVMNLSATSDHSHSNHAMNMSLTSDHSCATSDHSHSYHVMNLSATSDHSHSNHVMNLSSSSGDTSILSDTTVNQVMEKSGKIKNTTKSNVYVLLQKSPATASSCFCLEKGQHCQDLKPSLRKQSAKSVINTSEDINQEEKKPDALRQAKDENLDKTKQSTTLVCHKQRGITQPVDPHHAERDINKQSDFTLDLLPSSRRSRTCETESRRKKRLRSESLETPSCNKECRNEGQSYNKECRNEGQSYNKECRNEGQSYSKDCRNEGQRYNNECTNEGQSYNEECRNEGQTLTHRDSTCIFYNSHSNVNNNNQQNESIVDMQNKESKKQGVIRCSKPIGKVKIIENVIADPNNSKADNDGKERRKHYLINSKSNTYVGNLKDREYNKYLCKSINLDLQNDLHGKQEISLCNDKKYCVSNTKDVCYAPCLQNRKYNCCKDNLDNEKCSVSNGIRRSKRKRHISVSDEQTKRTKTILKETQSACFDTTKTHTSSKLKKFDDEQKQRPVEKKDKKHKDFAKSEHRFIHQIHQAIAESSDILTDKLNVETETIETERITELENIIPLSTVINRHTRKARIRLEKQKSTLHRHVTKDCIWRTVNLKY